MTLYTGVYVRDGRVHRMTFEAETDSAAQELAKQWGVGLDGRAEVPELKSLPPPEAYDEKTARQLLGGISRTTLFMELKQGYLERLPGTRRLLITRRSIEKRADLKVPPL